MYATARSRSAPEIRNNSLEYRVYMRFVALSGRVRQIEKWVQEVLCCALL
jgi:hypothetical protein